MKIEFKNTILLNCQISDKNQVILMYNVFIHIVLVLYCKTAVCREIKHQICKLQLSGNRDQNAASDLFPDRTQNRYIAILWSLNAHKIVLKRKFLHRYWLYGLLGLHKSIKTIKKHKFLDFLRSEQFFNFFDYF